MEAVKKESKFMITRNELQSNIKKITDSLNQSNWASKTELNILRDDLSSNTTSIKSDQSEEGSNKVIKVDDIFRKLNDIVGG